MGGVVPGNLPAPLPMSTAFIEADQQNVLFFNFEVGVSALRKQHDDYIKNILVPHYINEIESLGFPEKTMIVHPLGRASATGNVDSNMKLSIARAQSVGNAIKKYFDQQKARGKIAAGITVSIDAQGEGDQKQRGLLGAAITRFPSPAIEKAGDAFRSVAQSLHTRHIVNPDDQKSSAASSSRSRSRPSRCR